MLWLYEVISVMAESQGRRTLTADKAIAFLRIFVRLKSK
jgi:hypothetical protein